jgi:hypothetical protein
MAQGFTLYHINFRIFRYFCDTKISFHIDQVISTSPSKIHNIFQSVLATGQLLDKDEHLGPKKKNKMGSTGLMFQTSSL